MGKPFHHVRPVIVAVILLAGMTIAVFAPVVSFHFINVDDPVYVTGNDHVQQGLTWRNAAWALTHLLIPSLRRQQASGFFKEWPATYQVRSPTDVTG